MRKIEKISSNLSQQFKTKSYLRPFSALFEAIDSFILTPSTVTTRGCHIRDAVDMKRVMITVMIALIPVSLFGMWNVGSQHFISNGETASFIQCFIYGLLKWLPITIVTYVSGLFVEVLFAQKRGHEVAEGFFVTGMILPLILPPDIPLWIVSVATMFAVLFAKEVFGGTGYNFLNPALVARAFIFFAYPSVISGDGVWIAEKPDAISGATPLAMVANGEITQLPSISDLFFGFIPGCIGETSVLCILLGAILLIFTGVGSWRIMVSTITGGLLSGLLFNVCVDSNVYQMAALPAYYHILLGGFMFGAVFMATDPVTAPITNGGKIVYGFLIGFITVFIRVFNKGYVEGMMLAILLMNVLTPLINYVSIQLNINRRMNRVKK